MGNNLFVPSKAKFEVTINQKGNMKAQVNLLYGYLKIKGYRVMKSDKTKGLFVTPPSSLNRYGRYSDIVFVEDKPSWEELQNKILNAYQIAVEDFEKETNDLPKQKEVIIEPDEIPF